MVAHPAIRTHFFVKKEEDAMSIEELGKEFPLDEELVEAFKGKQLSDAAKAAIEKAVKILSKWKDDMPADCVKALGTLTKAAEMAYGYSAPQKSKKEEELEAKVKDLEGKLTPEARKKEIDAEVVSVVEARLKEEVDKKVKVQIEAKEKELIESAGAAIDEALAKIVG